MTISTFKALILDSFMRDGIIQAPESSENFFKRHQKLLMTGTAVIAGAILGPIAIGGVIGALGFGEAGIAAGSIAAWMMSLQRGAVAAGSLVAILQSVGAAGLGIGAVIAAGSGGGIFGGFIAKAILNILKSNPEGLAELENKFVSINEIDDDDEKNQLHKKVIFVMKQNLLKSNENKNLTSFLTGFDLARGVTKEEAKKFEFLFNRDDEGCSEGIEILHQHLIKIKINGNDRVTSKQGSYVLNLNDL
ncbi:9690_t:CDS:1 [Funneliformis geosporum]|uniref:19566_t:CDS:1 n=1 Tax=Funneliformis geosporum TaxID=1117311 RepID=A0A9W4WMK0_9GLOM|nr:9690_t:CDS:1 [Funneliformis geosporum]CAI2173125.1 19566_t:CDS:1 [Funneliformis geosporum]